jgi:hypothetical protein
MCVLRQVRNLKLAALEVRKQQQQQRPGTRAASLLTSLPPELADTHMLATLAQVTNLASVIIHASTYKHNQFQVLGHRLLLLNNDDSSSSCQQPAMCAWQCGTCGE